MLIKSLKLRVCAIFYLIFLFTSTLTLALVVNPSDSQPFGIVLEEDDPLKLSNQEASTQIDFIVPSGCYLYQERFLVELESPDAQAAFTFPLAESHTDEFLEETVLVYKDDVALQVNFKKLSPRQKEVKGKIVFQGCCDKTCYRPARQPFAFKLVEADSVSNTSAASQSDVLNSNSTQKSTVQFILELFGALLMGVLSSFSVCVLPLVPLTLSFMGANSENVWQNLKRILCFILGLISMNAPLGMAAAALGLRFGFQYQNPWFLLGVTLLFFVMGLWMLGVFVWQLPAALQTKIVKVKTQGLWRAYFSGLTIGLLAFACVGPFILPLLALVAGAQSLIKGSLVMIFYSLGLSGLFVAGVFFSTAWMRTFGSKSMWLKRIMGFILILIALFFGSIGFRAHIWPYFSSHNAHEDSGFFITDSKEAFQKATLENKKVVIDFYADWCLPCQEWDIKIWSNPSVQETLLKNYVPLKVDCTTDTTECQTLSERYNIKGMPTVVFVDAQGQEVPPLRLVGVVPRVEEFLETLKTFQSN